MKHISRYYKRLHVRNLKIAVLAVFVSIFFLPVYVGFQHTGDNMFTAISYTHIRAHETPEHLVCRLLIEKKKQYTYSRSK